MSRGNPWTQHRQSFWIACAGKSKLPLWHRVYALAYGSHRCNGHAPFGRAELVQALTIVDRTTGEMDAPRPDEVSRAIRLAARHGFLSDESWVRCLVVPEYAISGGLKGSPTEICKSH
jgi:hypothetical protein